jgi:hypothetical protein
MILHIDTRRTYSGATCDEYRYTITSNVPLFHRKSHYQGPWPESLDESNRKTQAALEWILKVRGQEMTFVSGNDPESTEDGWVYVWESRNTHN